MHSNFYLARKEYGALGTEVWECGCGVVCGEVWAQRSKEGKTRIRSPRVGEAVRLRVD